MQSTELFKYFKRKGCLPSRTTPNRGEQGLAPISPSVDKRGYNIEIFSALKPLHHYQTGIPLRGHPKGLRDPEKMERVCEIGTGFIGCVMK